MKKSVNRKGISVCEMPTIPDWKYLNYRILGWIHLSSSKFFYLFLMLSVFELAGQNSIVLENSKTGNPVSEWQISGAGDRTIQGFATDISYNKGETARFKIKTGASAYRVDIYRLGYYQGAGARFQGNGTVTASLPQTQPDCITDSGTGLLDCGNWGISANWSIPSTAVSGLYIAKLTRTDTGGSSHIAFVVRDDSSNSDLFFQTSDATWQAYNVYGDRNNGKSLYTGSGGKAVKVSYNRPFLTRSGGGGGGPEEDWLFNAEYPMIRWIEANGYDVTYTTNVDSDRRGDLIKNHKIFLSVGHDEYWSGNHRAKVVDARNSGTHLAFFSGNEVYWKTRWETSIDGNGVPYRTLVCYKEGSSGENVCNGKCDPSAEWTGLWRTGCEYQTGDLLIDGCQPENALTGQISWELSDAALQVPAAFKELRFWRNTSVANLNEGQTASFTYGTIGYEWNSEQEQYRYYYPPGRILLSRTVINGEVHNISLYKHSSGALVFGAGTVQWSWGLDRNHDRGNAAPSTDMQQATLNLFADMGAQPGSIQPGLVKTVASTDNQGPITVISSPIENQDITAGAEITISGTATDDQVLAGVEVSTDGGNTWKLAEGTENWDFQWTPTNDGISQLLSRSFDDSGNIGSAVSVSVNVSGNPIPGGACPCTVFATTDAPVSQLWTDGGSPLQLGMKFRSSVDGYATGVRFYKQTGNSGTHTGQLYSREGNLLGEAVFDNETTSGWQEVEFSSPVAITANTTYVISYHSSDGYYSADEPFFKTAIVNGPLTGLQSGTDGANGLYRYSTNPVFPTQNWRTSNYYVDVVFNTEDDPVQQDPQVAITSPLDNSIFDAPVDINIEVTASDGDGIAKVEFFEGINKLGEDSESPYVYNWNAVTAGIYSLTAVAIDNSSASTTSAAVEITVNDPSENSVPTVDAGVDQIIILPVNSATFTAIATDEDGIISSFLWEQVSGPAISLPDLTGESLVLTGLVEGVFDFRVTVTDDEGGTASDVVGLVVNPEDLQNVPPVVAITFPADNSTFTAPADISIAASASDEDGGIAKVEFFSGTEKLGEDLESPFSFDWNNVVVGSYVLSAVATDNLGEVTTSQTVNVTVSLLPGGDCPCSVFSPSDTPGSQLWTDGGSALQLGMKFRSSVDGFVSGARFYKQSGNSGVHTGQLYSREGNLLAEAVFTNETTSGWQEVAFSSPVAITANTTYVISYHSSDGYYSADEPFFNTAVVNGPLTALQSGTDGANGLYRYSNNPVFPTQNWRTSNYYVDVVFDTEDNPSEKSSVLVNKASIPDINSIQTDLFLYPNPTSGRTTIRFMLQYDGNYLLSLFDSKGAFLKTLYKGRAQAGVENEYEIDGSGLQGGSYFVHLKTAEEEKAVQMLINSH